MAVEFRAKGEANKKGPPLGRGIACYSLRCGHCVCPVLEGQLFVALDAPYLCLLHLNCEPMFKFDGRPRAAKTAPETHALMEAEASHNEKIIEQFMSRPYFNKSVPASIRSAWRSVFDSARKVLTWRRAFLGGDMNAPAPPLVLGGGGIPESAAADTFHHC